MTISHQEQVGRGLTLLGQGLYPYVEREMQAVHDNRWLTTAKSCLLDDYTLKRNIGETLRKDVSALLTVMLKQWDKVFKKTLGYTERALISELLQVRNKWAHQSTLLTEETYRALDSIALLLKSISALEADIVEQQKREVFKILVQEQSRYEVRPTPPEESRIRERLDELLDRLPFQDASLLQMALTHRSYIFENPNSGEDNERLEFLGDALLTFLSGEYLYRYYSEMREGQLTPWRSKLVDNAQLAKFATALDVGKWIRLGKGTQTEGGRTNPSLLSNTFEAIIGAYFLDSGIEAVRNFVEPLFTSVPQNLSESPVSSQSVSAANNPVDAKNLFQQWVHANISPTPPKYVTVQAGGLSHVPEFIAKVLVGEKEYGEGKGRSKKDAEKCAAEDALAKLKKRGLI